MLFELESNEEVATVSRPTLTDLRDSTLAQIAQNVATTGQLYNICRVSEWLDEHPDVQASDQEAIMSIESILCMPIVNGQNKVIGVVQLINKVIVMKLCDEFNTQFLFKKHEGKPPTIRRLGRIHPGGVCNFLWPRHSQYTNVRERLQANGQTEGGIGMSFLPCNGQSCANFKTDTGQNSISRKLRII